MQLRVFIQPRIMEDGTKRYFQLKMDPLGPGVLPISQVLAGDPYFRINKDTGALEGCYFAFIADFPDPQGTLRAETLNSFGRVDSYAACHAVNNFDPIPQGHTRAGLLVYMGAIPASLRHDADQWQRRWVLLDDCRVVPFYYNPQGTYRPKELAANEYPPGIHTSPGHCQEQRKVVGPYSEFAAIIQNEPLKLHKDGTRVCTALSRAKDLGMVILDKPIRHWALHKRPAHLLLSGGLRVLQRKGLPVGLLLYAMTVYDETHPRAFTKGAFGVGGSRPDKDNNDEGPKGKQKGRARANLRDISAKSDATMSDEKPRKRKATTHTGEGLRAPKARTGAARADKPSKVGTTASAVVAGTGRATSESHGGMWDNTIHHAITDDGPTFQRMQLLISQLQRGLPLQPARGLPLTDFLGLQALVASYQDPAPNRRVPEDNRPLMELCGMVLLPAALGMSVEAVRFVIILLRALLSEKDPVLDAVRSGLQPPRKDNDDEEDRGPTAKPGGTSTGARAGGPIGTAAGNNTKGAGASHEKGKGNTTNGGYTPPTRSLPVFAAAATPSTKATFTTPRQTTARASPQALHITPRCYDCAWLSLTALSTATCNLWL
jgi:hypothetical protein